MDTDSIGRKADSIGLGILIHDLVCYSEDLQEPITDALSFTRKLRHTRNVFISLHNVKDMLKVLRVRGGEDLVARIRTLRRELDFAVHVRNKGVGHLDRELLKRASQWEPHIFHEDSKGKAEFVTFLCYKALLESSINSYHAACQGKRPFSSEIDLLYPLDAKEFFDFLLRIIHESISVLTDVRNLIDEEIEYHTAETLVELAAVAGQTNFNLNASSELGLSTNVVQAHLQEMLGQLRAQGTDENVIAQLEERLVQWEEGKGTSTRTN